MKNITVILIFVSLMMVAFFPTPTSAQVIDATPTPESAGAVPTQAPIEDSDGYAFNSLGINDRVMNGPYDFMRVSFNVPSNWELNPDTFILLHLNNVFTSSSGMNTSELIQATGATLSVSFNGRLLTTVVLNWSGERTINIPVSLNSLASAKNGQNNLSLSLNAGIDCKFEHQTSVVVLSDSRFYLKHNLITPQINLVQFPNPIYLSNGIVPNEDLTAAAINPVSNSGTDIISAALITPDNPTSGEMQAALIVNAGLGHLTGGGLPLVTIPVSQLTDQIKQFSHLIFVGKGEGFAVLSSAALPIAFGENAFKTSEAQPEDGLIQEAISPWNSSRVILVISSESDQGIIKAAQALSSGVIRAGARSDMAIVKEVVPGDLVSSVSDDRTLADLGYEPTQLSGVSVRTQDYLFFMPPGQAVRDAASLKLMYTNSPLLNFGQSSLSVLLNGQSIGGLLYSAESAKSVKTEEINIPGYLLHTGMNRLTIQADHSPVEYCSNLVLNNLWTNISNQSTLHIPLAPISGGAGSPATLANLSDVLGSSPTLDTTAFIIAQGSPKALTVASQIAFQLGKQMTGGLVELKAAYGNQVPDDLRSSKDLVLVGRASQLPIIAELGSSLPAPFENGSDVAQESAFRVIYRTPPNFSLGYLELLSAPWDTNRNILAVLGSTDEGLAYSGNALTIDSIRSNLGGNFAVIQNEHVITAETRLGNGTGNLSATLLPGAAQETVIPTEIPQGQAAGPVPFEFQTGWILPVVGLLSVLIIIVLAVVIRPKKIQK